MGAVVRLGAVPHSLRGSKSLIVESPPWSPHLSPPAHVSRFFENGTHVDTEFSARGTVPLHKIFPGTDENLFCPTLVQSVAGIKNLSH